MNRFIRTLFAAVVGCRCSLSPLRRRQSRPQVPARQDGRAARRGRAIPADAGAGLPGEVSVKVGAVDPRTALAACPAPEAFLQPGARAWGKTTVGVRCTAPSSWTMYIQAQVNVKATTWRRRCRWPRASRSSKAS
jgi:flagella basal body P-ring formation protein FlgA